jgi:oxygen-independent coproporphyrinogen-3 oxidase
MEKKTSALYIHIPFCLKKCKYCDFTSYSSYDKQEIYFDALIDEIKMHQKMWKDNTFDTIFFGGGPPSSVEPRYIKRVLDTIKSTFNTNLKEISIEANPGTVDSEKLKSYIDCGINRISFGMQATQDDLLCRIGRIHTFDEAKKSVELAKRCGFQNINVDLMTGLPGQNVDDLLESIKRTSELGVNHISMYTLKLEEGTALYHEVMSNKTTLPDEKIEYNMSKQARRLLNDLGYERYEISNYAKDGAECMHNLHYWYNDDYLGLGVSASSSKSGYRTMNVASINEYVKMIKRGELPYMEKEQSSDEEFAFETLMLGLRLTCGVDIEKYYKRHGIKLLERFDKIITKFEKQWHIDTLDGRIRLTESGLDIQNAILVEFMEGYEF